MATADIQESAAALCSDFKLSDRAPLMLRLVDAPKARGLITTGKLRSKLELFSDVAERKERLEWLLTKLDRDVMAFLPYAANFLQEEADCEFSSLNRCCLNHLG